MKYDTLGLKGLKTNPEIAETQAVEHHQWMWLKSLHPQSSQKSLQVSDKHEQITII